jgi:endoglucanase Acf2
LPSQGVQLDASDPWRLVLETAQRPFAFFLPRDGRWEQVSPVEWIGRLPPHARHVTVAALPDATPQSLALLTRHAYIRPVSTHVRWNFDEARARVHTTFSATTEVLEGEDTGPLYGLYPHHWHQNASVSGRLGPAYTTVRGPIRLLAARDFSTEHPFFGFVPFLPAVSDTATVDTLRELMDSDVRNARRYMLPEGQSAYWQGKGFQRVLKLVDVLERQGRSEAAAQLLEGVKRRLEEWLGGADRKRYFFLDRSLGVLTTHPSEFHAVEEINDQHFWFGYWIRTVAEVALRDPAWAADGRWGAIVDLMVSNIANADRSRRDFPFLRTFDPYEGHSWANGLGGVGEYGLLGNNQESSSEALNAWAGLLLWAEFKGDRSLRALAAYLLSTEWQAVEHYWFDVHRIVLPPQYRNVDVAMVFGAGYAHNTWWTDEPRQISGINLLPITTSSTPLGRHPDYIRRNLDSLREEEKLAASRWVRGKPPDIWQDLFAKYRALADPEQALKDWNRWGAIELGETRSATLHWLQSLHELGLPDFSVWADTPLHAVFKRPDGVRTYLAFNASAQPQEVRFSDGVRLTVGPRQLSQTQGKSD